MSRFMNRRSIVGAVIAALVVAGSAYAYWTSTGTGTGSATTASGTTALTAVQTTTVTGMYPGDTAQPISGNFNNPNSGPIRVNTVTASIASVVKAAGVPASLTCDASDFTLASPAMTVNAQVPAGTAQGSWTGATIQFNNKSTAQDGCKGATVNLAYAIS